MVAGALVFGVLVWAAMLRPRVWATEEDLVLRNMLHTARIPLAAIEQVVVRQVLAVSAGEQRYVSPAIGKSLRQTLKSGSPGEPATARAGDGRRTRRYPDFVEERISRLAEDARAKRGIGAALRRAAGARRRRAHDRWAWPEIVGLVVAGLLFVLSLLV